MNSLIEERPNLSPSATYPTNHSMNSTPDVKDFRPVGLVLPVLSNSDMFKMPVQNTKKDRNHVETAL